MCVTVCALPVQAPDVDIVVSYIKLLRSGEVGLEATVLRKFNTIKTYLGAIASICFEFGIPHPPHKKDKNVTDLLAKWKDKDEEVSAQAFDMCEDLPKLWSACWTACRWSKILALRNWAMFLVSMCIFARASDVTTFCPLLEHMRLPDAATMWDVDGFPKYIEITLRYAAHCPCARVLRCARSMCALSHQN